jgi:hypothetical protein
MNPNRSMRLEPSQHAAQSTLFSCARGGAFAAHAAIRAHSDNSEFTHFLAAGEPKRRQPAGELGQTAFLPARRVR